MNNADLARYAEKRTIKIQTLNAPALTITCTDYTHRNSLRKCTYELLSTWKLTEAQLEGLRKLYIWPIGQSETITQLEEPVGCYKTPEDLIPVWSSRIDITIDST